MKPDDEVLCQAKLFGSCVIGQICFVTRHWWQHKGWTAEDRDWASVHMWREGEPEAASRTGGKGEGQV